MEVPGLSGWGSSGVRHGREPVPGYVRRASDIAVIMKRDRTVHEGWSTSGPSSHCRFEFAEPPSDRQSTGYRPASWIDVHCFGMHYWSD
jgi:hypothetical protein